MKGLHCGTVAIVPPILHARYTHWPVSFVWERRGYLSLPVEVRRPVYLLFNYHKSMLLRVELPTMQVGLLFPRRTKITEKKRSASSEILVPRPPGQRFPADQNFRDSTSTAAFFSQDDYYNNYYCLLAALIFGSGLALYCLRAAHFLGSGLALYCLRAALFLGSAVICDRASENLP